MLQVSYSVNAANEGMRRLHGGIRISRPACNRIDSNDHMLESISEQQRPNVDGSSSFGCGYTIGSSDGAIRM